jgi:hypothetical protein
LRIQPQRRDGRCRWQMAVVTDRAEPGRSSEADQECCSCSRPPPPTGFLYRTRSTFHERCLVQNRCQGASFLIHQ